MQNNATITDISNLVPSEKQISLSLLREDLLHPDALSGNKYRKLKYNILEAKKKEYHTLLTFGGAFSNHIAATSYAGKLFNVKTIGIIRGQEIQSKYLENPTLRKAWQMGMQLHFVDRLTYRNRNKESYLNELKERLGSFYLIPEGGTNTLGVKGCKEILYNRTHHFDYICIAVGTAGTISGLSMSAQENQYILGFSALKDKSLSETIERYSTKKNWKLYYDYHFGGYAKTPPELINFIKKVKKKTNINLEPIYTGKMLYGIIDLIKKGAFTKGSRLLAIHTGGLQGLLGLKQNRNIEL